MTSSSKQLIELARNFAGQGEAVDERVDQLILRGPFATAEEQAAWLALRGTDLTPFKSLQIYDPEIGGDLDGGDAFVGDRKFVLTIVKPKPARTAVFAFSAGVVEYLKKTPPEPQVLCAQLEPRAALEARGLILAPWDCDQPITEPAAPVPVEPRKFVRDYAPAREVADDLSPWILTKPTVVDSLERQAWTATASRRLLGGLVSSAVVENGVTWLQASGPPIVRIRADDPELAKACKALTEATTWVFLTGQDVEVRHMIFAAELARAYRADQPLTDVVVHAVESAKATYEAHVQSASRDTLKALGDLRKSVIDEAQKVTQRAQDLTSGLWRDVAVSAAPFVLKVLGDATKVANPIVTAGFYFAAAIFIVISFALQTGINESYLTNQRKARTSWFETLYGYISADERKRIADQPIADAEASYQKTKGKVGWIYIALVIILAGFGLYTLITGLSAPAPISKPPPPAAQPPATPPPPAAASSAPPPAVVAPAPVTPPPPPPGAPHP